MSVSRLRVSASSAMMVWVMNRMRRRLKRSATTPPIIESSTIGRKRARPMPLTTMGWSDRVRRCQSRAALCICEPAMEMSKPPQSRAKRRCWKAGGRRI